MAKFKIYNTATGQWELAEARDVRADKIGDTTTLNTTEKSSVVGATNEINNKLGDLNANEIDETNLAEAIKNDRTNLSDNLTKVGIGKINAPAKNIVVYFGGGDSTSDLSNSYPVTNSPTYTMYDRINKFWNCKGGKLEGITLKQVAKDGQTLLDFLNNVNTGAGIDDLISRVNAESVNKTCIIVFSLGHNGTPSWANYDTRLAELRTAMSRITKETKAYMLLRMPNAWAADETFSTTTAQEYSDVLQQLYNVIANETPRTELLDVQTDFMPKAGVACWKFWYSGRSVSVGEYVANYYNGSVYKCTVAGVTGSTAPTFTSGTASDGTVTWQYIGWHNVNMGDHTHPNQQGYSLIADLICNKIYDLIDINIDNITNGNIAEKVAYNISSTTGQIGKLDEYEKILSARLIKTNGNKYTILADYDDVAKAISTGDIVNVYDKSSILDIDGKISKGDIDRQINTSYSLGDFAAVNMNGNIYVCECVQAGTSSSSTTISNIDNEYVRNTWIGDSTVRWRIIKKCNPASITINNLNANYSFGTEVKILRRRVTDTGKCYFSNKVTSGKYLKLGEFKLTAQYREIDMNILLQASGGTVNSSAMLNIMLLQSNTLGNDCTKSMIVKPLIVGSINPFKFWFFNLVTTEITSTYTKVELWYYQNVATITLNFIPLLSYNSNIVELFDNVAIGTDLLTLANALPTAVSGTTTVQGVYNNDIYLGSPDLSLWKLTVNNSGTPITTKIT